MRLGGFDRIWFLTWTTYGSWLPGDDRGFVSPKFERDEPEGRNNHIGEPYDAGRKELLRLSSAIRLGEPVRLTSEQAEVVRQQFRETAQHRGWSLLAGAIMHNHVHVLVGVTGDPDPSSLLRDFKSYASRALNSKFDRQKSGTWWTEQGSKRKIDNWVNLETVLCYIRIQHRPLAIWEDVHAIDETELPGEQGA